MQETHQQTNEHQHQEKKGWYDKYYKFLLIIPVAFLLFSIIYLIQFNAKNGDLILKDISITGGTTVNVIDANIDIAMLENKLRPLFPDLEIRTISEFGTGEQKGFIIEAKAGAAEIKAALESELGYSLTQENSSVEFSGSALSEGFYKQLRFAVLLAFIFMAIVVFIIFRTFIPSFAVILSAFADIIMTLVVVNLVGMQLSIAGVIAFLMLIGYSVDTDILLTSRVLKRSDQSLNQRLWGSFKTGITMTLTSIAAVGISLIIILNISEVLRQIFTIILIGLGFDIFNTWITNTCILKWYVERREAKS